VQSLRSTLAEIALGLEKAASEVCGELDKECSGEWVLIESETFNEIHELRAVALQALEQIENSSKFE